MGTQSFRLEHGFDRVLVGLDLGFIGLNRGNGKENGSYYIILQYTLDSLSGPWGLLRALQS